MGVDVVVVGAGPVGLWLAAELRTGGLSVVVLEARHEPDPRSKALTIHPRTLELLASRGLHGRFLAEGPEGADVLDAAYVVGCDGTRSTVREAGGVAFSGTGSGVLG
ncbi:FAD-dependent oxidoreductase [Saccharothrix sp. BKS2]|uniref:FAD-dependent oxidoreductase n=1 Tax=Saccharothrix sp. BKS2 TaxID=3064400 RepID=UPI0039E8B2CE